MSSDSPSQFALTASVESLATCFAQLAKQDQSRSELTDGLLKRLHVYEQDIDRLKMDLEDQTKSRIGYQQQVRVLSEQKMRIEQLIDKDPYVVVLIDGDGSKFLDELLQEPVTGAAKAAQRLNKEIKDYLKDTPLSAVNLPILVRVFANLNDLARSLRLSNVIESADNMRTFAEQFTNSRAEFDFINVGRGKENADAKMRKMFNHFMKNFQCKKIFFAGCHDNGYLHDLREHAGDPDAKERIVLLETTPAEPGFLTLGFSMIRLDTVFRSEPLGSGKVYTNPNHTLPNQSAYSPVLVENATVNGGSRGLPAPSSTHQSSVSLVTTTPSDGTRSPSPYSGQTSTPAANVSSSGNGGISIKYPSSYAAAGGTSGHQNISVQIAKTKEPKTIYYNSDDHRLDPPIKTPGYNNPSQVTYKEKTEKIKPNVFCNHFYLAGNCALGAACERDHSTKLTPGEIAIHRFRARTSVCPAGPSCDDYNCCLSHHCPYDPHCARPECKFKNTRFGDLHLSEDELVPA
ncbi:hypothetical protein D0Z07_4472 [Hyphodiscus hymeniophilus]|uniref:C3H1-type domain-containing protein n=1 Tax=Hyphodiscus hymeniophilus TaxID=353542 RepID=A0A9P6VK74_9HELO|nr:hypothetical protein D0Z07_4472 [Hyphodiscus hymeniophilus]